MAIGAAAAAAKRLAKKAADKAKAAKATPVQAAAATKRAANLEKMQQREQSATRISEDLHRGIEKFRSDAKKITQEGDARLARRSAATVAAGGAAGAAGSTSKKEKTADPVAARSRTSRQRDR
jgi:hypothetical protein